MLDIIKFILWFNQIKEAIAKDHEFTQTLSYLSWIDLIWSIWEIRILNIEKLNQYTIDWLVIDLKQVGLCIGKYIWIFSATTLLSSLSWAIKLFMVFALCISGQAWSKTSEKALLFAEH